MAHANDLNGLMAALPQWEFLPPAMPSTPIPGELCGPTALSHLSRRYLQDFGRLGERNMQTHVVNLNFEEIKSWLLIKSVCMFKIPVSEACVQHYRVACAKE